MIARALPFLLAAVTLAGALAIPISRARAASFPGTARVSIADPTGGVSWNDSAGAQKLTVSCWIKLSVPSGVTINENMVILANRNTGTWTGGQTGQLTNNHAFAIYLDANTGNLEFSTRGPGGLFSRTLIERPYLERWYHVAIVRDGTTINGFTDGRLAFNATTSVGNTQSTDGISIGGLGSGNYLLGEVIQVQIFQFALQPGDIAGNRFAELIPGDWPTLRGYFKLAYSTTAADQLKNFASVPPTGTDPANVVGTGLAFEETNREGEQSVFDSRKNQGRDAVGALSGPFSWDHDIFTRATPGVPFEFTIGYNSGIALNRVPRDDGFDPFAPSPLGAGWRHNFQTRVLEGADNFSSIDLMAWDGSIETWDFSDFIAPTNTTRYKTRHKEYRGELEIVGSLADPAVTVRWITPDRLIYIYRSPFASASGSAMLGRLKEIQDFTGNPLNRLIVNHYETGQQAGLVRTVTDTGGDVWTFFYENPTQDLLTRVTGPGGAATWTVNFTYTTANGQDVLATKSISSPATYIPVSSTQWQFVYTDATDAPAPLGILKRITDPRGKLDSRVTYDKFGRKVTELDALSRTTQFEYNKPALRQLTTTRLHGTNAALNRVVVDTFDRKLRLLSRLDPLGFTTTYDYDEFDPLFPDRHAGNVTAATDARGVRSTMTYDARSNVTSRTNGLGETMTWEYSHVLTGGTPSNKPNKEIRPATAEAPAGWENRYEYDSAGNLRFHRDGPVGGPDFGTLAEHSYDARGLVFSSKDANGNDTRFTYDPTTGFLNTRTIAFGTPQAATWTVTARTELGWPITETNPLNEPGTVGYNVNGQVVSTTDAINRTFTKAYDANGNLTAESDGKAVNTTYSYSDADERITMTNRDTKLWDFRYNEFGEPKETEGPPVLSAGTTQRDILRRDYDKNGRVIKETDPIGKFVTYEYDPNGNQTAMVDKIGKRWEKTYDSLNRVIAERDPEGNTRRTTFDAAGRVLAITSPRGFRSTHVYDGRGRLTRWKDPEGFEWIYSYDGVGNILAIEDALHGHYVMTYGPRNERLTERNQDLKQWTYTYDPLVRLKTQTNPPGTGAGPGGGPVVRTLFYDTVGRLDYVQFNTGRLDDPVYDLNNNVISLVRTPAAGPGTSLTLGYDALDRLTSSTDQFGKIVGYGYDALSRVVTKTYPDSKVLTHEYDRLGRLTKLSFTGVPLPCTFTYDDAGRLTGRTYPNGITQTNTFDDAGRIKTLGYNASPTQNIALAYAYDRNGNKTNGTESGTLAWKSSDLTSYQETAAFKPDGKLISRTDALSPRDFTYTYDDAGNLTQAATVTPGESYTLSYDEDNRTTGITWEVGMASKVIANRYDALGRRISRTLDGTETRYVLDLMGGMERILCDTDAAGAGVIKAWYIHGPDLCFKVTDTGALTCYHADAQGNIVRTTGPTGNTINQYAYTPYGRAIDTSPVSAITDPTDPYRFVGSQGVMLEFPTIASSNLYFMRARYYSADAAVFFATDSEKPIGPGWKPEAYGYAFQNPYSYEDADGEMPHILAAAAIGAGIGAGFEIFNQVRDGEELNWGAIGAKALDGAIVGAVGATTLGTSFIGMAAVGAASGYVTGGLGNLAHGEDFNHNAGINTAVGSIGGLVKPLGGEMVPNGVGRPVSFGASLKNVVSLNAGPNSIDTIARTVIQKTGSAVSKSVARDMLTSSSGENRSSKSTISSSTAGKYGTVVSGSSSTRPAPFTINTTTAGPTPAIIKNKSSGTSTTSKSSTVLSKVSSTTKSIVSSVKSKASKIVKSIKSFFGGKKK